MRGGRRPQLPSLVKCPVVPAIDFQHLEQYAAAIEFLAARGIGFHTRPPLRLVVRQVDYQALEKAGIVPAAKANGSRGKKSRTSNKSKTGGTG